MGRKNGNARHPYKPNNIDLSIELNPFNPQSLANECICQARAVFDDIDPVEVLYVWLVWGVLGILFVPSLLVLLASL